MIIVLVFFWTTLFFIFINFIKTFQTGVNLNIYKCILLYWNTTYNITNIIYMCI